MPSGIQNVCMAEAGCAPDHDEIPPATLKSIQFNLMTSDEIEKSASIIIAEASDLSSPRLGLPNPSAMCETCGSHSIKNCDGHFGMLKLPREIYHPYFLPEVVHILNQMCVGCKCIRNNIHMKDSFSSRVLKKSMDDLQFEKVYNALSDIQKKLLRKVVPSSKNLKAHPVAKKKSLKNLLKQELRDRRLGCKYCHTQRYSDEWYPKLKFKIVKEKYGSKNFYIAAEVNEKLPKKFKTKCLSDAIARDFWDFVPGSMNDSEVHDRTKMVLSPFQAFNLLKELDKDFIETFVPRRDLVFISCIPVTSNCHRVSEVILPHSNGPQLVFDQRTAAYRSLLNSKRKIDDLQLHLPTCSAGICKIVSSHFFNCLSSSSLYGSTSSTMNTKLDSSQSGLKWLKDVVIGKRSDHTFNMVVVGDPKIKLGEIGIPRNVSGRLVISEYITAFNHEKSKSWCNFKLFQRKDNTSKKKRGSRSKPTIGDISHRPLEDGDTILAYRPPSVHHHSLIALRVKILPVNSVVSINPLCCAPFKGDFDGDILFGFIPQSVQCRIELDQLVRLDCQLFNNQDGRNLLSLSHDSLTAAHLLMGADTFLNKFQMQQLQMLCPQKMVCPAILKSPSSHIPIWTGWQLFSSLLPQSLDYVSELGTSISNGEVLVSPTESLWLQNTNDGFFSTLFKCYGRKALDTLFTAQEMLCEWISSRGFSVSLNDLYICADQYLREKMIAEVASGLQHAKHAFHVRSLMLDPEMINFCNLSGHRDFSCITRYKKDNLKRSKMNLGVLKLHSVSAFTEVFQDTRTIIHHYAHRKNSFLQMIHAGSKGSFTKLFQQAVCLGLLNSTSSFPFEISQGLHNNEISGPSYSLCCEGKNAYGFIGSSFLEGLNPRECLFHAISARPNFFSENAELPGTLNRKLMLYMRDLYTAYDGSVRNLYGQQIVQFLYDNPEKSHLWSNGSHELLADLHVPQPQEPVGVLSASAVSEAAYGGLDQPTLGKSSPLMNLKKLLNSGQRSALGGQTTSLALSKKLRRWNHGFEYGALEVQRHLERVFLSDITKTVLILYTRDVAKSVSPWVSHFHLSKKEMIQRRMTLQSVIDVLEKKYSLAEETQEQVSCKLNFFAGKCPLADGVAGSKCSNLITDVACDNSLYTDAETGCKCRKCLLTADWLKCKCRKCLFSDLETDRRCRECLLTDDEEGCNDTLCFTITMESSEFETRFEDLRDILVPFLLKTVVRGFKEYKKVEILWDDEPNSIRMGKDRSGELFVKVSLSEPCTAKSWTDLQCACIPIMGLIDWERSHPDSVWDVCSSHGIECAWEFFLKTLKTVTTSLGRTIKEQHLLLVADCLTATGQFSGLSAKGIKLQRKHFSISSPFMLGCSYRPADTFVNAAKQGATDNLLGTTDAMAWGSEAPVGTGGSFDILFSGEKFDDHGKLENIYQSLVETVEHSVKENNDTFDEIPSTSASNKWESWSHFEEEESGKPKGKFVPYGVQKRNKNFNKIFSKRNIHPVSGGKSNAEIVNMYRRLQNILHRSPINSLLDMHESSFVLDALLFHPDCQAKIGTGVQDIKIGYHPSFPKSRCFFILRKDGTIEDFSFKKCVIGASKKLSADCDGMEEKRSFTKHSSKRS